MDLIVEYISTMCTASGTTGCIKRGFFQQLFNTHSNIHTHTSTNKPRIIQRDLKWNNVFYKVRHISMRPIIHSNYDIYIYKHIIF